MSETQAAVEAAAEVAAAAPEEQPLFDYTYTSRRPVTDPLHREPFTVKAPNLEEANRLAIKEHGFDPRKEMTSPELEDGCPEVVAFQAKKAEWAERDREARKPQVDALREQLTASAIDPGLIPSDEVLDGLVKVAGRVLSNSPEFAQELSEAGGEALARGLGTSARRYAGPGFPGSGAGFTGPSPFERFMLGGGGPPPLMGQSPFGGGEDPRTDRLMAAMANAAGAAGGGATQRRIELFREVVCGGAAWLGERLKLLPRAQPPGFQAQSPLNPTPLYTLGQEFPLGNDWVELQGPVPVGPAFPPGGVNTPVGTVGPDSLEQARIEAMLAADGLSGLGAVVDPYAPTPTQDEVF